MGMLAAIGGEKDIVKESKRTKIIVITIHQEHMEKWQEEIKELPLLDVSNEEAGAILQNAKYLIHNICVDS
ncbi:unnamed protein product [Cuscuta campestris]|uniref:Uncharacterized protein n=1 Tax=Cuscuta campestris TaxID=132261 RepID=A0A484KZ52_9ASTE|nr:unnamed protein product [Cuscuta campestris]